MGFKVAVIYYSRRGRLVTLANVIAEGVRQVEGAEVTVYRIRDPVLGDAPGTFDEGVLDAPVATPEVIMQSDCVIIGGPGRQGRMCAEVSYFFDSLTEFQTNGCLLKGKVGSAFTSVGGVGRGYGGHEAILQSFHGFFLQHGMIPVGVPPSSVMEDAHMASPFGVCMTGRPKLDKAGSRLRSLSESEVKLAYSQGEWASIITKQLHDDGD
ncbi:predicted protein [Micromonas commoda]|uniref:NAD(P)H dehydrogenase (quinone) n=1 Tax=Micromonas commoda (strain RCC299 / NOUM17 / CCMP2709) TaxID=296587 RepID=C1EDD1_MICCC|nr:predicted protein [Micromonas commoda]ACO66346.1 predicted protein [Micromonas commoda]|eukprot:XP_002505088.1 predicted protein [Micromonas commoda]